MQAKQKKEIKIVNLILVKDWTRLFNKKCQIINLVDLKAKINLINYIYIIQ